MSMIVLKLVTWSIEIRIACSSFHSILVQLILLLLTGNLSINYLFRQQFMLRNKLLDLFEHSFFWFFLGLGIQVFYEPII